MVTEPTGVPRMRPFVWTVVANEPVTVPAGTFLDVLRIRAGWADDGGGDSSYAKGFGFVRGWGDGSADDWNSELTAYHLATWVPIQGNVRLVDGTPICAMVLANDQYMFSCGDSQGRYDLTVPADGNGTVTVFGFADGFQPYSDTFVAPLCGGRQLTN